LKHKDNHVFNHSNLSPKFPFEAKTKFKDLSVLFAFQSYWNTILWFCHCFFVRCIGQKKKACGRIKPQKEKCLFVVWLRDKPRFSNLWHLPQCFHVGFKRNTIFKMIVPIYIYIYITSLLAREFRININFFNMIKNINVIKTYLIFLLNSV